MAGSVSIGTGAAITFSSGFLAEITNIENDSIERPSIDTTHMGSTPGNGTTTYGGRTFVPGELVDPGEMTIDIHYDPDTIPPIHAVAETVTLTFNTESGESTPTTIAGSGFMKSFSHTTPLEDKKTASVTIKFSGVITVTAAT